MKILFAEDTEIWVTWFLPKLKQLGEVTFVKNGMKAKRAISKEKFDIIVSDHQMPGCDGGEVYNFTRQNERSLNKETPYIIFSAGPDMKTYNNFNEDDNSELIMKGLDAPLIEIICSMLNINEDDYIKPKTESLSDLGVGQ